MLVRRITLLLCLVLPLAAGCTTVRDGVYKGTRSVEREAQLAGKKVSDYMEIKPLPSAEPPPVKAVPPIYCYRVLQDVVCYNQPLAGAESRLVGKQGEGAVRLSPPVSQAAPQGADSLRPTQEIKLEDLRPVLLPAAN